MLLNNRSRYVQQTKNYKFGVTTLTIDTLNTKLIIFYDYILKLKVEKLPRELKIVECT